MSRRALALGAAAACALAALLGIGLLLSGGTPAGGPQGPRAGGPGAQAPGGPAGAAGRGTGPALPAGGDGAQAGAEGDGRIPPEVLSAIRGGPLPTPPTGTMAPPGEDWTVRQDGEGLLALRQGGGAGGGAKDGAAAGGGAGDVELARRAEWVKRQERRNDLRVQVMRDELGVSETASRQARQALTEFVTGKVTLYESIEGRDDPRLRPGLEALRQELAGKLAAAIGQKSYDAYAAMDAAGKFALPEEKKNP